MPIQEYYGPPIRTEGGEINLKRLPPPSRFDDYGAPEAVDYSREQEGAPVYTMQTAGGATATAAQDEGGLGLLGLLIIGAVIYFATKGK
jgi:hypothetical protein